MTKEVSQVWAAEAVRRLTQEEELDLKPERLLRMRWVKYAEGGDRRAKARLVILGYQHPECEEKEITIAGIHVTTEPKRLVNGLCRNLNCLNPCPLAVSTECFGPLRNYSI